MPMACGRRLGERNRVMKISARNQLKGTVKRVREGAVSALVLIGCGNQNPIKADITLEAVRELGLAEGVECYAVMKSSHVMFAIEDDAGLSARNQIEGTVVEVAPGAVNGCVTIEVEKGVRITGTITNDSIRNLGLEEGSTAFAIVKASDVMVAID